MNILVVDDEHLALERMRRLLKELHYLHVTTLESPIEAIKRCTKEHFDVIFLDIDMPHINGIETAQSIIKLLPHACIIFSTVYDNHALSAYQLGAIDYLVKPLTLPTLQNALEKACRFLHQAQESSTRPLCEQMIIAKQRDKIVFVKPEHIYYIQADLASSLIRTQTHEYYANKRFSELEHITQPYGFLKIHRSILINLEKITYITPIDQGRFSIHFQDIDLSVHTSRAGALLIRNLFGE